MQTGSNDISLFDHDAYQDMNAWFRTPLGEKLLTTERRIVENMLSRRFGYHLLQLGCAELVLHDSSPMGHKFSFCAFPEAGTCHNAIARGEEIPLGSESVDLVLLHHALDFSDQQHQLLREVSRILIAGGHVIIVGFNPISSWGIRNKLLWWKQQKPPWHASLLSSLRLTDWLKLLDFQVDQVKYGCYTLPVNSPAVIRYSSFLERLADRLNWPTGGIYTIVARKQVIPYYSYSAAAPALAYAWAGHAHPGQDFAGIQEFPRSQQRRSRPIMPAEVKIYTDGACRGNPGPGGWGAVLEYGTESKLLHGGEILTTNNRMELMAVIQALSALKRPCKIALVSDSKYVLKGITEWLPNWKQKGWRTAAKKPVMNSDLWQQLDALVSKHEISWHWVKGHSGHVQNELADQLANKGIDELMSGVAQVQVDLP